MECTITFYLDSRRPMKNDMYFVKLRVYAPALGKKKLYTTSIKLSEKDFEKVFSKNPKGSYLDTANELNNIKAKAIKAAQNLSPFTFEMFEKEMFSEPKNRINVFDAYQIAIDENRTHGHVGNADNYQNSLNSIKKFIKEELLKKSNTLLFTEITPVWLQRYEEYMKKKR